MKLSEYVYTFSEIQCGEPDIIASMMTNSKLIAKGIDEMDHRNKILFHVQKLNNSNHSKMKHMSPSPAPDSVQ